MKPPHRAGSLSCGGLGLAGSHRHSLAHAVVKANDTKPTQLLSGSQRRARTRPPAPPSLGALHRGSGIVWWLRIETHARDRACPGPDDHPLGGCPGQREVRGQTWRRPSAQERLCKRPEDCQDRTSPYAPRPPPLSRARWLRLGCVPCLALPQSASSWPATYAHFWRRLGHCTLTGAPRAA
jgi:hypothetical protein